MPEFMVTAPDGAKYKVNAPEGATEADAIAYIRNNQTAAPAAPPAQAPLSWSDVGSQALQNAPSSAYKFGEDIVQSVLHPIETAKNVGSVIAGGVQKAGQAAGLPAIDTSQIPAADAVGEYFANRYGGVEEFKRALAADPVGVAGDLSTVLTGGGGAAARLPGIAGRVGEVVATAGRAVDPLRAVGTAGGLAGQAVAQVAGLPSGVGGRAVEIAHQAGREGGAASEAFRENLRGVAPIEEVVADARDAVRQMRRQRGAEYTQEMQRVGADRTILSWNDVDTAINDMNRVANFRGQSISPSTTAVRNEINTVIGDWKNLRASEFWTPEGFDALKQRIGDIKDLTQPGTRERLVADQAYNAIKKTIVDQVPEYARTMRGYERASSLIKEIETTLSVKPTANIDTALRKLQSVLRNNVNTNFGRRERLAEFLENAGAPNLMAKLAGQSLSSVAPRGLMRAAAGAIPVLGGAALASGGLPAVAAIPLMSPRLVGEAAHGIGAGQRYVSDLATLGQRYPGAPRGLADLARQAGRLPQEDENEQ